MGKRVTQLTVTDGGTVTLDLGSSDRFDIVDPPANFAVALTNASSAGIVDEFVVRVAVDAAQVDPVFPAAWQFRGGREPAFAASQTYTIEGRCWDSGATVDVYEPAAVAVAAAETAGVVDGGDATSVYSARINGGTAATSSFDTTIDGGTA